MKNFILYLPVIFSVLLFQNNLYGQCELGDLNAQNMAISPGKLYSCGKVTITAEWLQQAQVDYDADFQQATLLVSLPNEFIGTTGTLSVTATDGGIYWDKSAITVTDNEIQVPLKGVIPSGEGLSIILSDMDITTNNPITSGILYVSQSISNIISDCQPRNDEQTLTTTVRTANGPSVVDIEPDCSDKQLAIDLSAHAGDAVQDREIVSYSWTGPNGFSSGEEDPSIRVSSFNKNKYAGIYNVTVTDANGCSAESSIDIDGSNCSAISKKGLDIDVIPGDDIVKFGWRSLGGLTGGLFSLERSTDGHNFTKIGEVEAYNTTKQITTYDYTDYNPVSGTSYYRVKTEGINGVPEYSKVKVVTLGADRPVNVFPNPVMSGMEINIQGQDIHTVRVYNMLGQLVISQDYDQHRNNISISTGNLPQGMYVARVNDVHEKKVLVK